MDTSIRRNSGSSRTAILCLIAAACGAGAALFFAQKEKGALQAELSALREQARQLEAKSTDPKEGEKLRAQVREAAEFKKEAEEVHRLRGEVTLLRKDKAAFERASAENTQLRVAAQQAQRLQAENNALRGQFQSLAQAQPAGQPTPGAPALVQPGQARNACIANLKQIDGAIQRWALENRKVANSPVDLRGFLPYLQGSMLPLCPSGGAYRPGPSVSAVPNCTIPGHAL